MSDVAMDKLNKLYETHKDQLNGSFHNCLWQVMINESLGEGVIDAQAAFMEPVANSGDCVVIAFRSGGFISTMFAFNENLDNTARQSIINDLNSTVFGLTEEGADSCCLQSIAMGMNERNAAHKN